MGEVPLARHLLERTVEVPAKPMKRAAQFGGVAVVLAQLATAMQARVEVRLDLTLADAHNQNRLSADVVVQRVAHLGDVIGAARHLPDAVPHLVLFELVELAAGVPADGNVGVVGEVVALPAQHHGHVLGARVGVEQLLIRDAW